MVACKELDRVNDALLVMKERLKILEFGEKAFSNTNSEAFYIVRGKIEAYKECINTLSYALRDEFVKINN